MMVHLKFKNYYLLVIWRVILAYILYSLSRIFFLIYNYTLIEPISLKQILNVFKGGLMFDTTAILYTNILYIFLAFIPLKFVKTLYYQKILKFIYVIFNFLALSANIADTIYFRFTMRRTSMTFFSEFTGDVKFFKIFLESISIYWYAFVIAIVFLLVLIFLSGYYNISIDRNLSNNINYVKHKEYGARFYVYQLVALIITAPLFIIGVRGGTTHAMKPININNAGDFVDRAIHMSVVLNTPFSLIRTIGKPDYKKPNFYPDYKSMESIYTPIKNSDSKILNNVNNVIQVVPGSDSTLKRNVVIVMLESFAAENMKFLNSDLDKNYTPFLDSLRKEGLLCTNAYANGRKSIDAIPSIFASIPSLVYQFAVSPYSTDQIQGFPRILDTIGYYTAFFHGAPNNSMGIRAVANLCGIKNYFGKDEFGDNSKFDGSWGIWDEYFLDYVADRLPDLPQPFMAGIFTLSSHHPFKLPEEYKDILPKGETPIQSTIAYTDMALRKFFDKIKTQPWFNNTIFVIVPDHATLWGIYPKYTTPLGSTAIPIIYYSPNYIIPGVYDKPTQQIDIMPTILGLLNYNKPYFAFGRDLNRDLQNPFVINYGTEQYQLVLGDTLLVRDNNNLVGVYNYKQDSLLKHNLLNSISAGVSANRVSTGNSSTSNSSTGNSYTGNSYTGGVSANGVSTSNSSTGGVSTGVTASAGSSTDGVSANRVSTGNSSTGGVSTGVTASVGSSTGDSSDIQLNKRPGSQPRQTSGNQINNAASSQCNQTAGNQVNNASSSQCNQTTGNQVNNQTNNQANNKSDVELLMSQDAFFKAFIQQYLGRLIDDMLEPDKKN